MTGEQEKAVRRQQMASLGSLLADFSHEMRNHLAVIQEANGLLEDLLAMEETEGETVLAALGETAARIGKRLRISAELCRHLSSMAHRSDTAFSSFQVNELLAELIILLERSARSRQISVRLDAGQGIEPVYNEAALVQYLMYQLYIFFSERMQSGQTLCIRTAQAEKAVAIQFCLHEVPRPDLSELSETVTAVIASLGAGLEELKRGGQGNAAAFEVRLLLPSLPIAGEDSAA